MKEKEETFRDNFLFQLEELWEMPYLSSTDSQLLDCHAQKLHTSYLKKNFNFD